MGLDTTFQKAAHTAFGIFKDVAVSARFESVVTTLYDASSGVSSTICYSGMVTAIFQTYDKKLVDGERIKPSDVKALVLPDGMPRTPIPDDTLHTVRAGCSVAWRILMTDIDPAGAMYTMQLRRKE